MSSIGRFCLVAAVAGMGILNAFGTTWYAAPSAKGTGDCSDPENAGTVSKAFELAESGTESAWNEIVLADARYDLSTWTEADAMGDHDGAKTFFITDKQYLRIRSAGGDPAKCVFHGGWRDKGQAVRCFGVTKLVEFSGITIENFDTTDSGSAICATGANLVFSNLVVSSCCGWTNGAVMVKGALTIYNSIFENNTNSNSEGYLNSYRGVNYYPLSCIIRSSSGKLNVYGSTFRGNGAAGGGIHGFSGGEMVDTTVVSNAIHNTSNWSVQLIGSYASVRGCTFIGNLANENGCVSATLADDCVFKENTNLLPHSYTSGLSGSATNCTFEANTGFPVKGTCYKCSFYRNRPTHGSGVGSNSVFYDCAFTNNWGGWSGVIANGTAIRCLIVSNGWDGATCKYPETAVLRGGKLIDCVLIGNAAGQGGQMYGGIASNCLFIGSCRNSADDPYHFNHGAKLVNCTVVDSKGGTTTKSDVSSDSSAVNTLFAGSTAVQFESASGISHCIYQSVKSGVEFDPSAGNRQVEVANMRWYKADALHPFGYLPSLTFSDAIDKGDNLSYGPSDRDLAGCIRVARDIVDIGCYEYWPKIGLLLFVR